MEGIQVSVDKTGSQGDISIIRVGGYIDTTTSSELERALDGLLKAGVFRIIIDLNSVDYISSAGWGIFISEIKGIRERGGDLKLARMIPDVFEVFELLEFHYILKAFDTIEQAIRDFDHGNGMMPVIEEEVVKEKLEMVEKEEKLQASPVSETENAGLEELIRKIALENPSWSAAQIAKILQTDSYGNIKISRLAVWKALRKMHLGSKKSRTEIGRKTL
ncbi:STAS domain-containing protein [bacterium]|nr:STAS domain-containing protein [bacterium]